MTAQIYLDVSETIRTGNLQKLDTLLQEHAYRTPELLHAGMMDSATQCLPDRLNIFLGYLRDSEHATLCFQQTVRFAILTTQPPVGRLMETLRILVRAGADISKPLRKPIEGITSVGDCLLILKISEEDLSVR